MSPRKRLYEYNNGVWSMKMTIDRFLEEMSKYEWQLLDGNIRSREFVPDNYGYTKYPGCPLTYIAYKITGKIFRTYEYTKAAYALEFENAESVAQNIAKASDTQFWTDPRNPLREQLEKAAKVKSVLTWLKAQQPGNGC